MNRQPKSLYGRSRPAWAFGNVMKGLDTFGFDVPTFKMRGKSRIDTLCGGVVSVIIFILVIIYSSIKAVDFFDRRNP